MKHLHTLGIAFGFKTATTCCGKRVKFADLAVTEDADCPACRASADEQHALMTRLLAQYRDEGRPAPDLEERMAAGPVYRNALSPLAKQQ